MPEGTRLEVFSDPNTYVPEATCNGTAKGAGKKTPRPCRAKALPGESYCKHHLPRIED